MKLRFLVSLVSVALLVCASPALAASTSKKAAPADTVKIGVHLPLSGEYGPMGNAELWGIQLANKVFPTVLGKKVELIVEDNKSTEEGAAAAADRLIKKQKVNLILGSYNSDLALAAALKAEKAGIPLIGTTCTNPLVTHGLKYAFRACSIDPDHGAAAASHLIKDMHKKNAAILSAADSDYSTGLCLFFRHSFRKFGGSVVLEKKFHAGDTDFSKQLKEIMESGADVLYIPVYPKEGSLIIKQARTMGAEFTIMGADALDVLHLPDLVGKNALDGVLVTGFPYDPGMKAPSKAVRKFNKEWKLEHPEFTPGPIAVASYSAYQLAVDAIERAGSVKPLDIVKALENTKKLSTPLGRITINATHDAELNTGIFCYTNGVRHFVDEELPD